MFKIEPYTLNNKIYSNSLLTEFIVGLEKTYLIEDQISFYSKLVNFSKNDNLPYHGWFKYREGYASELVKNLIKEDNLMENEFVIDPFCGSGTTLIEAATQGYSSLGIDVNPMSALVADTKVKHYSIEELDEIRIHIMNLKNLNTTPEEESNKEYRWVFLEKYFSPKNFSDIKEIVSYIENIQSHRIKQFLLTGCLAITEEISDRKRDGNGLKNSPTKIDNVNQKLETQLLRMVHDVVTQPVLENREGFAISSSANLLEEHVNNFCEMTKKTPGAIIFSPPYANSFDYFESYKLELHLGNFVETAKDMKDLRDLAVHSFVKSGIQLHEVDWYIDAMAAEIEEAVPEKELRTGKKDLRTRKVPALIRGYFSDMEKIIRACSKVLPTNKRTYIVVDQSAYLGKIVPTDLFFASLAEKYDFEVEKIIVCRRARTSAQQYKLYPYLDDTLRESIVVLKKK